MKKVQLLLIVCFMAFTALAQLPQTINYQAVARTNAGIALANQTIQVRLTVLAGLSPWYSETRIVTTNALGLFNVQIGSAGATNIFGTLAGVDWTNSTSTAKSIKVELDISNTNVYTDMGTQALSSVPYAFAAKEAINTAKIGGNNVATVAPQTNDILRWDGTAWTPATVLPAPQVYTASGLMQSIPFGGGAVSWTMASSSTGAYIVVTVAHGQSLTANFVGAVRHNNVNAQPISFAVCYSDATLPIATAPINALFQTTYVDATVAASPNYTILPATGAAKVITGTIIPTSSQLPPGTYRIFLGIKNKSSSATLAGNDFVNGTVTVF